MYVLQTTWVNNLKDILFNYNHIQNKICAIHMPAFEPLLKNYFECKLEYL